MDEHFTHSDFSETENKPYSDSPTAQKGVATVKEKAETLKNQFSDKAKVYGDQLAQKADEARTKTSAGLRNTSRRMDDWASYLEAHDARDMSETLVRGSKEYIRENPGKSLVTGLVVGLLLGRLFSMTAGHRHPH